MRKTKFHSAPYWVLLLALFAACSSAKNRPTPDKPAPFTAKDYITEGEPGRQQALIYRIALSDYGIELLEGAFESARQRRYKEAVGLVRELTRIEPRSPCAFEQLGRLLYISGDAAGALAAFGKARELNPGDPFLEKALIRWERWVHRGEPLYADSIIEQLYPGYERYLYEHRYRPRSEGVWDTPHFLVGNRRVAATLLRGVAFELFNNKEKPPGAIVIGSSRVREGVRPFWMWPEMRKADRKIGPPLNFGYSGSTTPFWIGLADHLEKMRGIRRRIKVAVLCVDPETMSYRGIMGLNPNFKYPRKVEGRAWQQFVDRGPRAAFEVWPHWDLMNHLGYWEQVRNWSKLIKQPYRFGANPQRPFHYLMDPLKWWQLKETIETLKDVAEIVILVENPVPNFYRPFLKNTSRPHIERIAQAHRVPYYYKSLEEWGLNDGHFFGARNYAVYKLDWLHLNFPGSRIYSREIGKIVAREIAGH